MSSQVRAAADQLLASPQRELAAMCEEHGIELLVMFGSAARKDADPEDVDLAVRAGDDFDVLAFLDELYGLTGSEDFDILDLRRAAPVARERALVGVRLLHEATPGLFANSQIAAIMERMDTDEMRRLDLELMAR